MERWVGGFDPFFGHFPAITLTPSLRGPLFQSNRFSLWLSSFFSEEIDFAHSGPPLLPHPLGLRRGQWAVVGWTARYLQIFHNLAFRRAVLKPCSCVVMGSFSSSLKMICSPPSWCSRQCGQMSVLFCRLSTKPLW